jgi:hypothetical protein
VEKGLAVRVALMKTPLGGGVVSQNKQFCVSKFTTGHTLFYGLNQVAQLPEVRRHGIGIPSPKTMPKKDRTIR